MTKTSSSPVRAQLRHGATVATNPDGMTLTNARGAVFTLGPSGRIVVEALRGADGDISAARAALQQRYDLSAGDAERDVAQLIAQMSAAKLLTTR